jgi:hypothetical protein
MARYTLKSSTVFVSVGEETRVFRSVEDVPAELKLHFERSKGRLRPRTLLIADPAGREEIIRSLQGLPSSVKPRWSSAALTPTRPRLTAGILESSSERHGGWSRRQILGEMALAALIGAAITLAFWFS